MYPAVSTQIMHDETYEIMVKFGAKNATLYPIALQMMFIYDDSAGDSEPFMW